MTDPAIHTETALDAPLDAPVTETWSPQPALEGKLENLAARPEARAGAAFAGGLLLAMIVRRLGR